MIAIINEQGLSLQLSPNQSLVIELKVSWLDDDELPGDTSYPINAPLNGNNRQFVQHGYRPDAAVPRWEIPVTVKLEGVLYRRCTFSYRVAQGALSGYLKIDASEFYDKIRQMSLQEALSYEIMLGDGLAATPPVGIEARLNQIAALQPGQFPCTFFPIRNEIFFEDSFDGKLKGFVRNSYINAWEKRADGTIGFVVDKPNMPRFGYMICPQLYLSYVLTQIMNLAGYTVQSDWLADPEVQRLVIVNLTAMNMTPKNPLEAFGSHHFTAGMCLPDMSVGDFLKAVKGRFGLTFVYNANEKTVRIAQFTQSVQAGPVLDLTPYQSGAYSTENPSAKGITVSEAIDSADELYKDVKGQVITAPSRVIGKGATPISLKVGTTQLSYEKSTLGTTAYWFVPTLRQPGNVLDTPYKQSDRYPDENGKRRSSIGLKLLSYRGMTTDSQGNAYPLGTPDVRDGRQQIVGSQALTLTGKFGAWKQLYPYFYFRDQTQKVTQPLLLPVDILATLQRWRTVSLCLDDFVRRPYLISQIRAESPGRDGKAIVQLEVLTLPAGLGEPSQIDQPIVWVELIVGGETTGSYQDSVKNTNGFFATKPLTVKIWDSPARTAPVIVTNLVIQVRLKKQYFSADSIPPPPYEERVVSYLANGSTAVLDPALFTTRRYITQTSYEDFEQTPSLNPGEGYNILS